MLPHQSSSWLLRFELPAAKTGPLLSANTWIQVGINGFGRIGRIVSRDSPCNAVNGSNRLPRSSATREFCPSDLIDKTLSTKKDNLTSTTFASLEHGEVDIVAVNDPFIEPKYAVGPPALSGWPFSPDQPVTPVPSVPPVAGHLARA